jgi:hypothetical protein
MTEMPALQQPTSPLSTNEAAPDYDSWQFWKWLVGLGCTAAGLSAGRSAATADGREPFLCHLVLGGTAVACAYTTMQCVPSGGMVNIGHRACGGRGHVCAAEPENSLQSLEALSVGLLEQRRDFQYLEFDVQASGRHRPAFVRAYSFAHC